MKDHKITGTDVIIFEESCKATHSIMEIFNRNETYPLLIAQPQQGKTNVQISVADEFREKCKKENKTFEIIVLTNLSSNELKDQTEDRFGKAGLLDVCKILHHNDVNNLILKDVDLRLIMIDECHYALGNKKPFHNFLKRNGIYYGQPISTWINKTTFVLSISATPYATKIREELDKLKQNLSFETVTLEVSPNYFSLGEMKNRLVAAKDGIVENNNVSDWFKNEVLFRYFNDCKISNGYLVVRLIGEKVKILQEYLENAKIDYQIFDNKAKNISKFDSQLTYPINHPKILIIKGSYRAGKTLNNTKLIRGWVETKKSESDAVAQVVGRCCGYNVDGHSKFYDEFPIYCDIEKINVAINFYKDNTAIPSGNSSKSNVEMKDYEFSFISEQDGILFGKLDGQGVGTISGNNKIDIAEKIISKSKPSGKQEIYIIDNANNNYTESYKLLIAKYGNEIIGKCVYYKQITPTLMNIQMNEKLIKNKVMFSNINLI